MNKPSVFLAVLLFTALSFAQGDVSLRGTIKNQEGEPVGGAWVYLKNFPPMIPPLKVLTTPEGSFELTYTDLSVTYPRNNFQSGSLKLRPSGRADGLILSMDGSGDEVTIDIFKSNGARIYSENLSNNKAKEHRISLAGKSKGMYLARVSMNGEQQVLRIFPGLNIAAASSRSSKQLSSKISGSPKGTSELKDTLIIVAPGYRNVLIGLSEYTVEEDFDLELTASNTWKPESFDELEYDGGMVKVISKDHDFEMGEANDMVFNTPGANRDEQPVHTVEFTYNFWMDTVEVTEGAYVEVMRTFYPDMQRSDFQSMMGYEPSDLHPVLNVSWGDAALYCNALSKIHDLDTVYSYESIISEPGEESYLVNYSVDYSANGYRLPTEAEWEYAAKGGTTTSFYWNRNFTHYNATIDGTDEIDEFAVWKGNSWDRYEDEDGEGFGPQEVASRKPNAYGLYDMAGNAFEYVNDFWGAYPWGVVTDPVGPDEGNEYGIRGGSWVTDFHYLRTANRYVDWPDYHLLNYCGFRTVRRAED